MKRVRLSQKVLTKKSNLENFAGIKKKKKLLRIRISQFFKCRFPLGTCTERRAQTLNATPDA